VSKEYRQETYIQDAMDYHNRKHGIDIAIAGRCTKIYLELK